jgi:Integrase core domain
MPRSPGRPRDIERGSPWENGYIESFNARLRDQLLNGEIFYTLREAQIGGELAASLQRDQAARIQTSCTGGVHTGLRRPRWRNSQPN